MERKIITIEIGEIKEFNAESYVDKYTDISEVISFFVDAKNKGATHVAWYACTDYCGDSESCDAQPFLKRFENDDEYNTRIEKENESIKNAQILKEKYDKSEYERLKAIFDKTN